MNSITHGELFVNEDYNGYDLSYLAVRYLLEKKTKEEIQEMVKNSEKVLEIGENVLASTIDYYQEKLDINNEKND